MMHTRYLYECTDVDLLMQTQHALPADRSSLALLSRNLKFVPTSHLSCMLCVFMAPLLKSKSSFKTPTKEINGHKTLDD